MIRLDTPEASAYREAALRKRWLEQGVPLYEEQDWFISSEIERAKMLQKPISYASYYLVQSAWIGETVTVKVRVT